METCGFILAVPVAIVVTLLYTAFAALVLRRSWMLSRALLIGSALALILFFIEIYAVSTMGILGARAKMGRGFEDLHVLVLFLAPPAIVNVLVLFPTDDRNRVLLNAMIAVMICSVVTWSLVVFNVEVDETLYGIDGWSGPYSMSRDAPPDR